MLEELNSICQHIYVVGWVTFTIVGGLVMNNIKMRPRLKRAYHSVTLWLSLAFEADPCLPALAWTPDAS